MEKLMYNKCSDKAAGCIERQLCLYTKVRNEKKVPKMHFYCCYFKMGVSF